MIRKCHVCEFGALGIMANGHVPCRKDPKRRDIIEMQIHGCPIGEFEPGEIEPPLFDADESAIVLAIDKAPQGLGDSLKALFEKIGVDRTAKLFEKITGNSCKCAARREWLNRWWPYSPSPSS